MRDEQNTMKFRGKDTRCSWRRLPGGRRHLCCPLPGEAIRRHTAGGPGGGGRGVERAGGLQETSCDSVCSSPEPVQEELSWEGRLQIDCGAWFSQLRGFWGLKCFSHVLWPFVFRNVNLQKEMSKSSLCIIHKACCLLKFSPTESSPIPQEALPISVIKFCFPKDFFFHSTDTFIWEELRCILPSTQPKLFLPTKVRKWNESKYY